MIDARKRFSTNRRHAFIAALLGIRHVVLAINKMDLVDYASDRFEEILADFTVLNDRLGFADITSIPVSALYGDNIIARSDRMSWYDGPALLDHLETVDAGRDEPSSLRLPVQYVLAQSGFSWLCRARGQRYSGVWHTHQDSAIRQGNGDQSDICR